MIACDIRFGSFVPVVPQIYKDAATDKINSDYELDKVSDCSIGPRWTLLKLRSVERYNHDTSIFEFELPDPAVCLCLPITAHLLVKAPAIEDEQGKNCGKDQECRDHVRPYTAIEEKHNGRFKIMVKLYEEWGVPESKLKEQHGVFLFSKTDHSYKPPGKVSTFIHSLRIGQSLAFKHNSLCLGKISYPFQLDITAITMIAVGVGVVPMVRILEALFSSCQCDHVKTVRLLYGVRTVADILHREQLDKWHESHSPRFQVCYCIGSRWSNVHFAAKTTKKEEPPLPKAWESVQSDRKELGWVDGDKVSRRGASSSQNEEHRIFICGLPDVYLALVGPRSNPKVHEGTQLYQLGYRDHQVVKF